MPSIINSDSGAVSGSAGLKFTSADDGVLNLQNNGNTAVAVTADNQASFTVPVSQPGAFGFRNRIINGNMAIDQRRAGAAQTITAAAALAYTVDRWYAYCTGANVTGQQVAGSGQSQYRYRFTGAASVTKIGFAQRIEAANVYDLNGTTATLGVDLANSLLTTVTWTAWYANTTDTFGTLASPTRTEIATGTFTVNSTVTRYTTQIAIPSAAITGIEIEFSVGAQTSGTWTIGDVQLERGAAATPFEQIAIGTELALCQRYYESTFPIGTAPAQNAGSGFRVSQTTAAAGACRGFTWVYKVTKRAVPGTITSYNPSAANANVRNLTRSNDATIANIANLGNFGVVFTFTGSTGSAAGDECAVNFSIDAEL